jgi:NADP-dependent 3-hydroxy acid dehydrogenase YdfG
MGKTILITGASSGFGRLTAQTLRNSGHKVFAGFRSNEGRKKQVADELREKNIEILKLDVTDQGSVDSAIAQLLEKSNNELDAVVNNAGMASAGISEAFTPEQARQLFEVHVFGVQRVLRATLPVLRAKRRGLVINVGSILGRITLPFFGLYGASKYAVEAMSDSYRYELSQLGVEVVLVQPSAYPTNMYAAAQQPADEELRTTYGEVAEVPGKILKTFVTLFEGENGPNPQDVATAIDQIVSAPAGSRPDRVVVGLPFGSDAVNKVVAPIQRGVIDSLGLGDLAKLKIINQREVRASSGGRRRFRYGEVRRDIYDERDNEERIVQPGRTRVNSSETSSRDGSPHAFTIGATRWRPWRSDVGVLHSTLFGWRAHYFRGGTT